MTSYVIFIKNLPIKENFFKKQIIYVKISLLDARVCVGCKNYLYSVDFTLSFW